MVVYHLYASLALKQPPFKGEMDALRIVHVQNIERLMTNCFTYSISTVAETRNRALRLAREVEFMRWFPVAFLTNGAFKVTHGGRELKIPVL